MKNMFKEIIYLCLIAVTVSISYVGVDLVFASDQRTYLAFDGLNQKSFADCVSNPITKQQLNNLNHITSSSLYQAVDKRIADLSVLISAENRTNNLEQYKLEEELDCLNAVRYLEKETIDNFYQSFTDIDTYLKDYAREYMGIDENGNIKGLSDCGSDIDLSDGHKFWLEFMSDAYYFDAVGWQRFADHDCLAAVLYLQSQQNNVADSEYSKMKVSLPSSSDLM